MLGADGSQIGRIVVSLPVDRALTMRLSTAAGLDSGQRLILGRNLTFPATPGTISVDGREMRALAR